MAGGGRYATATKLGTQPAEKAMSTTTRRAWSKEETDQLFELCERFDLRFIVIADRFPTARSVEDLKSRYYSASRALLIHRARSFEDVSGNPLVKDAYDAAHETERKRALSALLSQTKQQERKDAETLAEAKRIMESRAASKVSNQSMLLHNVDVAVMPPNSDNAMVPVDGVSPSSSTHPSLAHPNTSANILIPNSLRTVILKLFLVNSYARLIYILIGASAGLRVIKRVDQTLQELAVNLKPKVPTKAVCIEHIELRNELLTLLNLQKQLQNKEAEVSANRESSFTEAPSTPKNYMAVTTHKWFLDKRYEELSERAGKRDHKRKSTGRFIDAPPSPPQSKRPRKLKGSD
ncbi:SWR1-complex protein 4 [Zea mays]|uniref:SWR1-complex protein 4 n=1 Tax=Zea mays TaxID=4577 RepID=A0A1D6H3T2_MAIZE|nr:SWR1-complex protein 4 [Zea mays]